MTCTDNHCAVDCGWSDWTEWGVCDKECGTGVQFAYRSANHPAAING